MKGDRTQMLKRSNLSFSNAMLELNVLSVTDVFFESPQKIIEFQKDLRILRLDFSYLNTLSFIGDLSNLEVLSCRGCYEMTEICDEIGKLTCLKLLDLSKCHNLKKIAPGVISKLNKLEELKIWDSFREWESSKVCKENRKNVSLDELESLCQLTCLEIEIGDKSLAEEEIRLASLVKYKIRIGEDNWYKIFGKKKVVELNGFSREIKYGSWIQKLMNTAEELNIFGKYRKLDVSQAYKIEECTMLEKLVGASAMTTCVFSELERLSIDNVPDLTSICNDSIKRDHLIFPKLKFMELYSLPSLTSFSKGIEGIEIPLLEELIIHHCTGMFACPMQSGQKKVKFGMLKSLEIRKCDNMMTLFSSSMIQNLVNLKNLAIDRCGNMKQVIATEQEMDENSIDKCEKVEQVSSRKENEDTVNISHVTFPKLEKLVLEGLSSLTNFGKGIGSVDFPVLHELNIESCPQLKNFVSPIESNIKGGDKYNHDNENLPLFHNSKVKFGELRELEIINCDNISSLFSDSMVDNLASIKSLRIKWCNRMEKVIVDGKEKHENFLLFPSLEKLHVERLPMLGMFCAWKCSLELPLLNHITIALCRRMEFLTPGSLTTPKLEELYVDGKRLEVEEETKMKDPNSFLKRHIMSKREGRKKWRRFERPSNLEPIDLPEELQRRICGEVIPKERCKESLQKQHCELSVSVEPTTIVEKKVQLENLPLMVASIWTDDAKRQLEVTTQFRKLLSSEGPPPIQEIIQSGVVPRFVEFLMREDFLQLQFEAAWALTNIAFGPSEHTKVVIDHGAVPIFVKLLSSPSEDVREQAVWALGNVAGDSSSHTDLVIRHGALDPLLTQLNEHTKLSMLRITTWTLSNFCRGGELMKPAVPILRQLLICSTDEEVLTNACWALSHLCKTYEIEDVVNSEVCCRLVELLLHPSPNVLIPIGNIVTSYQIMFITNYNVLSCLLNLLTGNNEESIKNIACWTISHVTRNREQIQFVIEANLIGPLVQLLQNAEFDVKKEAAWAISNVASYGTHEQIKYLVCQQCIKPLCDMLVCPDPGVVRVCLKGLKGILKVGEAEKNLGQIGDVNLYAQMIDDAQGLEKIENLQSHRIIEIYMKAVKILETYWPEEKVSTSAIYG